MLVGTLDAMRPCHAVGRAWLLAVAASFLVVLSAESAEFLPTCAPWRGQRSFVVDADDGRVHHARCEKTARGLTMHTTDAQVSCFRGDFPHRALQ